MGLVPRFRLGQHVIVIIGARRGVIEGIGFFTSGAFYYDIQLDEDHYDQSADDGRLSCLQSELEEDDE